MVGLAWNECAFCLNTDRVVEPALHEVHLQMAHFEEEAEAHGFVRVYGLRDDGCVGGLGRELCGNREAICVAGGGLVEGNEVEGGLPVEGALRFTRFELGFGLADGCRTGLQLRLLPGSWSRNERRRVAVFEVAAALADVVEVGEKLVEIFLREGVVLVVVAAGTADSRA